MQRIVGRTESASRSDDAVDARPVRGGRRWLGLLGFGLVVAAVAVIGSLSTNANVDGWYDAAAKPPWTPPNWLFGPVWTVLYTGVALAGWAIWRSGQGGARRRRAALVLFWVQLALNAAWSPAFFAAYPIWGGAALWWSAAIILVLDAVVVAAIATSWRTSRFAAIVLGVYLVWLLYATSLNLGIAVLNG